jgi:adenine specific DNA methylase Mod
MFPSHIHLHTLIINLQIGACIIKIHQSVNECSKLDILGDSIRKQLGFQSSITWNAHKVILYVTRSLLV